MRRKYSSAMLSILTAIFLISAAAVAAAPGIQVLSPSAGETVHAGKDFTISWQYAGPGGIAPTGTYTIVLSIDNGMTFPYQIASALSGMATDYQWKVMGPDSKTAMIKIIYKDPTTGAAAEGTSGRFEISAPGGRAKPARTPDAK